MSPNSDQRAHKRSVALVIYVGPKVASRRTIWCLEKINNLRCIEVLAQQLTDGLAGCNSKIVLCRDEPSAAIIKETFDRTDWSVVCDDASSHTGVFSALTRLSARLLGVNTLLVFLETSLFHDFAVINTILASHYQEQKSFTLAPDMPVGAVPLILGTDCVIRLSGNDDSVQDYTQAASFLLKSDLGNMVHRIGSHRDVLDLAEDYPRMLAVNDRTSIRAAERVIKDCNRKELRTPSLPMAFRGAIAELTAAKSYVPTSVAPTGLSPRRVLIASMAYTFSGAEESLYSLVTALDVTRYRPICFFPFRTLLSDRLRCAGVACEEADFFLNDVSPVSLRFWRDVLDFHKPSVVHIDSFANNALLVAAFIAGIPSVFHVRFLFKSDFPQEALLATSIIAISDTVRRWLVHLGVDSKTIRTVYNGVDSNRMLNGKSDKVTSRRKLGLPHGDRIICMVARVCPEKQHALMLRALRGVLDTCSNTTVVFVGEALPRDRAYAEQLRQLADRIGVNDHVIWLGFQEAITDIYSASDALALCSRREPFGRCMLEAMCLGLPVIAPNVGGPAELLTHGEDGLLYEPDDIRALTNAILLLLSNHDVWSKISRNAEARARQFDIARHVREVMAVYDDIACSE